MNPTAYLESSKEQETTPIGHYQEVDKAAVMREEIIAAAKSLKRKASRNNSGGIDWVEPKQFYRDVLAKPELQLEILRKLLDQSYKHQPFLIIEIPKESGGTRKISIPTAVDRVFQRIACRILGELIENGKLFHENSVGYRNGRNVTKAAWIAAKLFSNYPYVIRLDLQSFYDSINRERLLYEIGKIGLAEIYIHIVKESIYARRKDHGQMSSQRIGIAQGGPLSPVLANIYLNPLDWYLDAKSIPFVRYADDILLFARTEEEVVCFEKLVGRYCVKHLGLQLNREKTRMYSSGATPFLGYIIRPSGVGTDLHDLSERLDVLWSDIIERPHHFYSFRSLSIRLLRQKLLGLLSYYRCTTNFADAKLLFLAFLSEVETLFMSSVEKISAPYTSCFCIWEFCVREAFSELRESINNLQPSGICNLDNEVKR